MIQFFASIFIKNRQDYSSPAVRQAYGTLCGAVGIGLNILLFLGKWMAGFLSGSIAITERQVRPETAAFRLKAYNTLPVR